MPLGFLLHPTYRIEDRSPVVHLFGVLDTGESFVVRDWRTRPHFFIRAFDAGRALSIAGREIVIEPSDLVSIAREPLARLVVRTPPDTPAIRDRLIAGGVVCLEADIPFATRFLIDKGLRGAMRIEGPSRPGRLVDRIFEDVELFPADWTPALDALSIDIETDAAVTRLLSVGLYSPAVSEVHLVHASGSSLPPEARGYPDEAALLRGFLDRVRAIDPDILVGWNLIDFDLSFLETRCKALRIPLHLGRAEMPCTLRVDRSFWGSSRASIPGRVALDGVALLRGAFVRLDDYRLDTAARSILGEGKLVAGHGRAAWIEEAFSEDLDRFIAYNLTDARLAYGIIDKLRLIPLAVRRSLLTGMPLDRVGASIASFDFLYLHELRKMGIVAPSVDANIETEATAGGYVLDAEPGIYDQILVFDYRSLYPSLILTFHLDPLSYVPDPAAGEDLIAAPNGAHFRRGGGILPGLLERFFPEREAAKQRGDAAGSTAYKILMNSFYGVLGTPRCRFHSPPTANAITSFGQMILLWTKSFMEAEGYRVLYGDTDSLFVASGARDHAEANKLGRTLAARANAALTLHLRETYRVESRLLLQFDRLYERFFLPGLRHSRTGSKKRYAGLIRRGEKSEIVFTGLESARRDWTEIAKVFQGELLRRVFAGEPVEEYIRAFVDDLRAGKRDGELVYKKALRKDPEKYTKTTPPHVKAARQMAERDGRLVSYVMTTEGAEPAENPRNPLDYDHYVEKQIRPVAEAVLACLGTSWARVCSGQADMFG
jgi:DNA polymerase-2